MALRVAVCGVGHLGSHHALILLMLPEVAFDAVVDINWARATELAASCQEVTMRGGTLAVATDNPALAHQLRLDADSLLQRLNAMALPRRVRALRVRSGRGPANGGL